MTILSSQVTSTEQQKRGVPRGQPRQRVLHAGAWWLWALGLAAAASRTLNPLVLLLVIAVCCVVVAARRSDAPWTSSFRAFLVLAAFVIVLRVVFEALFGAAVPGRILITLPQLTLPGWMAGARLGGPVSLNAVIGAAYAGLQLAAILVCVGAASALAAPTRLLKSVPGALYEVGVALVVALTLVPQTVMHVQRVREARRLRGRPTRGMRGWAATAMPVLNGALERSLLLAAAMDSRGYGRTAALGRRDRTIANGAVLLGLFGLALGLYGLLALATSTAVALALLVIGSALCVVGVARAGRRSVRTVYRPDPWGLPEWLCAGSGLICALLITLAAARSPLLLSPTADVWPPLPWLAVLGVSLALAPAWLAPQPRPLATT